MTLEEYELILTEKRKALEALKSEERKVVLDKEFNSMQLVDKKIPDEVFLKLVSCLLIKNSTWWLIAFCKIIENVTLVTNVRGLQGSDKGKKKEVLDKEDKVRKVHLCYFW